MIDCRNICLIKNGKAILKNVDLRAHKGGITVLMGKNGSGKTSLLRCISGAYTGYGGEIFYGDTRLTGLSAVKRSRIVSVMPQILPQPAVTVAELVAFGRRPYAGYGGRLSAADKEKVVFSMESAGILPHKNDAVCNLSGGERQIAFFAMILAQDTPAVLLDEPTANLDAEYRRRVFGFMKAMRDGGKTVIATLHSPEDAVELADRICVMRDGEIDFSGTAEEFMISGQPERNFGLRPLKAFSPECGELTVFRPYDDTNNNSSR